MTISELRREAGPFVIRLLFAGRSTRYAGEFVKSYDPRSTLPILETTPDPRNALRFPDPDQSIELYQRSYGSRPDGKPNRPLTVFTVAIMSLREAEDLGGVQVVDPDSALIIKGSQFTWRADTHLCEPLGRAAISQLNQQLQGAECALESGVYERVWRAMDYCAKQCPGADSCLESLEYCYCHHVTVAHEELRKAMSVLNPLTGVPTGSWRGMPPQSRLIKPQNQRGGTGSRVWYTRFSTAKCL